MRKVKTEITSFFLFRENNLNSTMNYSSTQNHFNTRRQQHLFSLQSQATLDSDSSQSQSRPPSESESDDDIPLGQRHPDALKAQAILRSKSIATSTSKRSGTRSNPIRTLSSESDHHRSAALSKLSAAPPKDEDDNQPLSSIKRLKSLSRPPPKIPSHSLNPSNPNYPISVDQLIQKLQLVQNLGLKPSVLQPNPSKPSYNTNLAHIDTRPPLRSKNSDAHAHDPTTPNIPSHLIASSTQFTQSAFLKSPIEQTSPTSHFSSHYHHIEQESSNQPNSNPSSTTLERAKTSVQTNRSSPESKQPSTRIQKSFQEHHHHHHPPASQPLNRAKSLSNKLASNSPSQNQPLAIPIPPVPLPNHYHSTSYPQQSSNPQHESKSPASKPSALHINTNSNQTAQLETHHLSSQINSPLEALPSIHKRKLLIKLAIVQPSQSIMVEIDQDTLPKDLLREAEQSGQLIDEHTKGTWGVFEVWRDLEIERPVREIEKIIKIVETWTSVDTNETYLLIQRNEISGLSVSKRSFTSGSYGGNLWCELKPGKWSKKFVLLRDNAIYLCSNDKTYIVMSQSSEEEAIRPKQADLGRARSQAEKTKPSTGLKRGQTLLVHQANARKETTPALPKPDNGPKTEPITLNTAGSLVRKPTLVKASILNKFKQGTLLGNLEQSANSHGPNQAEESPNTNVPAILPPHVMPLSTHSPNEIGPDHLNQADETNHKFNNVKTHSIPHKTTASNGMNKIRTWEQMGSEERKLYLNQVQNQAKIEGRTLLHFEQDNTSNSVSGGLLAGLNPSTNPHPNSNTSGSGLNRSKTLGSHHGRPKPPRAAL